MAAYSYEPLDGDEYIRLLEVCRSPGRDEGLNFILHPTMLTTKSIYEAVSYTWGSATTLKTIREARTGEKLKITQNCFQMLHNLCNDGPRMLWVDAICINQRHPEEKSRQLRKMADIYTWSTRTIVYLGEADKHWKRIAEYMRTNGASDGGTHFGGSHFYYHCGMFAQRPWFSRTWTLQEIILSSSHTVVATIGTQDVDWFALSRILREQNSETHVSLSRDLDQLRNLGYNDLLRVLQETAWAQCTKPLDKFYAVTSLFDETPPPGLHIDYTRKEKDLYLLMMSFLLVSRQGAALYETRGLRGSTDLPSWVVDWTELAARYTHPSYSRWLRIEGRQHHIQWWREQQQNDPGIGVCPSGSVLALEGWRVAVVESVETRARLEILYSKLLRTGTIRRYLEEKEMPIWKEMQKTDYLLKPVERSESSWILDDLQAGDSFICRVDRVTRPGLLKRFTQETRAGDHICVFEGFEYPFVLRSIRHQWVLVKTCRLISAFGRAQTAVDTQWKYFPGKIEEAPERFEIV